MNAEGCLPRAPAIFLLLALSLTSCNSAAGFPADSDHSSSASPNGLSVPEFGLAVVYPWRTVGLALALSDFDGDHRIDVAVGRQTGDRSAIVIHLTSRPGETVLEFSHLLACLDVFAYDINKDSYPDVVVASPFDDHPLAVWLGDGTGSFIAVDQTLFANDAGFNAAPSYDRKPLAFRQDLLSDSRRPDCENRTFAAEDLKPEPEPCAASLSLLFLRRAEKSPLGPRSPPDLFTL